MNFRRNRMWKEENTLKWFIGILTKAVDKSFQKIAASQNFCYFFQRKTALIGQQKFLNLLNLQLFPNLFSLATKKMKAEEEKLDEEKIGKFVSVRAFFLSHFLVTMGWIPLIIEDVRCFFNRKGKHSSRLLGNVEIQ